MGAPAYPSHRPYPDANSPPILRIPYVWVADLYARTEFPLVLLVGDKTELGSNWYPPVVTRIESNLIPDWERKHPQHRAKPRRRL